MKKLITFYIMIQFIILTGCSLPLVNDVNDSNKKTVITEDSVNQNSKAADTGKSQTASSENESNNSQNEEDVVKIPITLYYQDTDGYLIPFTRMVEKQQGIAKAAISGIIDSAISREEISYYGIYPVLPEKTKVLGLKIDDKTAIVDFSQNILDYDSKEAEKNIITSIVYTLTEFSTIRNVKILINGIPQNTLKYGLDISDLLNRKNLLINSKNTSLKKGSGKADIYYFKQANDEFTYLLPVSIQYTEAGKEVSPAAVIRLLLKSNSNKDVISEMPSGTKLLDCNSKNGIMTLNFDKKFTSYGGNAREDGILKQLAYTLKQMDGIKLIKILVDGKTAELPEGTDISSGIEIPETINDVIDR